MTLAVPLATFANPEEAIAAIKAKLAQSGLQGGGLWRGLSVPGSQPQRFFRQPLLAWL
jgi:hypothetical protein